jgi:hypothetical protein
MELTRYGGWPMVPSELRSGELTIQCRYCRSTNISLTVDPGPLGTGPGGRWRLGDSGGREVARCNSCGKKGELMQSKFEMGRLVATPAALEALEKWDKDFVVKNLLDRHFAGDWGDLDAEDKAANDEAVKEGERILSSYQLAPNLKIYVITEADRSATTVLLPDDY